MTITLEETSDPPGLEIHDSIEQRRLCLETAGAISAESADTEPFCFPLDTACRFETSKLVLDQLCSVTVHDETGRTEASLDTGETATLEERPQFVGLSGPIKLYCRIETAGQIDVGLTSIRLSFDRAPTIELGARSLHDRPVETITTSPDPDSMMEAISAIPSALKTTSPERTWPTLRGHPPLIELGDRLEIPDSIAGRESEIELVVPSDRLSVYQVAPLAFFLGATIQPGAEPRVETPHFEQSLTTTGSLEDDVARLLQRCFFLDCLVRTEGVFQYDIAERSALEADLPFDLPAVYDASLSERIAQYLEVPYERLEPFLPRWPLTAHLPADPNSVELVPYIVNELGIIREARGYRPATVSQPESTESQLVRSGTGVRTASIDRSETPFVVPAVTDESVEHAWFGAAIPQEASKATIEAYRNQLDRDERSESIDILLVCNDARMIDEHDLLDEAYGNRDVLPFEIHSEFGVDTERLATLLTEGSYDFVHYIGHATEDGIRCPDDDLDVRTLESVDVGVFFLNACRSYEQGLALTRRGAFGGVSTYADVINEDAIEAGETMARLLNRGFPLRGALEIAREQSPLTEQYLIVGDGSADIAQSDGGAPMVVDLEEGTGDEYGFGVRSYSTKEFKLGSVTESTLESVTDRHITPGAISASTVDADSLQEYLTWTEYPVLLADELRWNDGVGPLRLE
ncbi:hypothetical protein D8Y22_08195 [Salinadaptatus halalkaliphilus]|uniref:CHAT domain-containing protein n=1 Tax=Salinadaptatus halalkaliphilus TaxID=2419781 RepID=A0A4S3TRG9_9EURY|nr:hypothetical protein [Salinadaptatus halalkaliphilus]THE65188.1 hypothetical protein D8Y22_08195 [Salinadaptatus halalkaliphilus]